MRLKKTLFTSCLIGTLLLQGCLTVGPDYKRPHIDAPETYVPSTDAMPAEARAKAGLPASAWWTSFQSDALNAAIDKAMKNNPTIQEADAILDAAAARLRAARGADLPQIDATAGRARELINPTSFGFPGFSANAVQRYTVGASVSYDLDLFGGNRRAEEFARASLEAETDRAAAARLSLAGNVVLQALEIASLQSQINATQSTIASDRETLSLADRAIALGSVAPATRLGPDAQLAADEAALPPLQSRLAAAKNNFALLLGEAPGTASVPAFQLADFMAPAQTPISVPSELVQRRPDIRASEAMLRAAIANVGIKTAELYPKFDLTANISQMSTTLGDTFDYGSTSWKVGASAMAPIFHGGALRAQLSGAKADSRAAAARYQNTVLRAFVEVANALSSLRYDSDELTAQQKALKAADANLAAKRRLYELGRDTLLDVLDAQRQANLARRQTAAAEGGRLQSLARLYAATAIID